MPASPEFILQVATAFWPSKVLLTAVDLGLFTALAEKPMTAEELGRKLKLHPRGTFDFFDTLVALKFLEREGDGPSGKYKNTPDTAAFLVEGAPAYIGGSLKMLNARLFGHWNRLGEALRTGKAQSEAAQGGKPFFETLYSEPERLRGFLEAMSGFQKGNFRALAEKFDFSRAKTLVDVGGALASLSRIVAARHQHLRCTSLDLPQVVPLARETIAQDGLSARVEAGALDFFKEEFPKADIVTMGNILHDWNLDTKKMLIRKAYAALPKGGAFIAIENVIDDQRRTNVFGLLMSLNMLIEVGDGFDYTGAQFREWCGEAGFTKFELLPLTGPTSAAVAFK